MKYFIIFLFVIGFTGLASAEPPPPPVLELSVPILDEKHFQTLYDDHDLILDGNVIHHTSDRFAKYKIKVHQYFKNDLGLEEINAQSDRQYTGFMTGDRALFYLKKTNDAWEITPDSIALINEGCNNAKTVLNIPYDPNNECWSKMNPDHKKDEKPKPPLKQSISGIPNENIVCHNDLHLVIKKSDDKPACVRLESIYPLVYRGWASQEKLESSTPAFVAAQRFIEKSPTFSFDGILGVMSMTNLSDESVLAKFPPTYTLGAEFATRHQGYGDRSGHS